MVLMTRPQPDFTSLPGLVSDMSLAGLSIRRLAGMTRNIHIGDKRRAEFMAGRLCAAWALEALCVEAVFPLPSQGRLPVWPSGILGSISHCDSLAVCIAAMQTRYCALGIDVESLIEPGIACEIRHSIASEGELQSLAGAMPLSLPGQCHGLTQLFSAKEALYKALFPLTGRFQNFGAAEFCGYQVGRLMLRLTHDWAPCWPLGTIIGVSQFWVANRVISIASIPA